MDSKVIIAIVVAAVVVVGGGVGIAIALSNGGDSEPSYTVSFNVNGGDAIEDKTFTKNTDTFQLPDATREGYKFLGWYGSGDFKGEKITQVEKGTEKNITVWAKWQLLLANNAKPTVEQITANTDVKVTFNSSVGSEPEAKTLSTEVRDALTAGKTLVVEDTENNITWTFTGSDSKLGGYNNEDFKVGVDATPHIEDRQVVLSFDYDGTLPYQSTVRYLFGANYAGEQVTAINSRTSEEIGPYVVDAQGYVEFPINHCSDWTVTVSYNVTFDAAGGTIDGAPQKTVVIPYKDTVGDLPEAKKTGHNFVKWALNSQSPAISAATPVTDNVTYVAVWEEIEYTINFDKNSNDATGTMESMTIGYAEVQNLPACTFSNPGYSASWNFLAAGNGIAFGAGATITGAQVCEAAGLGTVVTLYAQWVANSYTIFFDGAQGSTPPGQTVTYGQAVGVMPESTRDGYALEGWYTQAQGAGTKYTGNTVYSVADNVTLYANWTPVDYTITYVLNGGQNAVGNPATYTVEDTIQFVAASRDNYAFMGWYVQADFNSDKVTQITAGTIGNITLYARWGANNANVEIRIDGQLWDVGEDAITLTLDQACHSMERKSSGVYYLETSDEFPISDATYTVKREDTIIGQLTVSGGYGELTVNYYSAHFYVDMEQFGLTQAVLAGTTLSAPQQIPSKDGYDFASWNFLNGTNYNFSAQVTGTLFLYAGFTPKQFTVEFDTDGGSEMDAIIVNYGSEIEDVSVPTREGFGFQGFFLGDLQMFDALGHPMGTSTATTRWTILQNSMLVAHWGARSVTLSFGNMGPALSATYGQPMPAIDPLLYTIGEEHGKRFVGLYDSQEGGKKYYNADLSSAVQTSDLVVNTTMYPHYENITYSVVYNLRGGIGQVPNDQTVQLGGTFNQPQSDPTRAGYTFAGWSYYEGVGVDAFENGVCEVPSWALEPEGTTLTLYAQWQDKSYTIHYDANGGSGQAPADGSARTGANFPVPEFNTTKGEGNNRQFFGGWNTAADGSGTDYRGTVRFDDTLVALAGDGTEVTLYVKWVAMEFTPSVGYTFTGTHQYAGDNAVSRQMIVIAVGETTYRVAEKMGNETKAYEFPIGTYPVMNGFTSALINEIKTGEHTSGTFTVNGVSKDVEIYTKTCNYSGDSYQFVIKETADGFICSVITTHTGNGVVCEYSYPTHAVGSLQPATVTYRSSNPSAEIVRENVTTFATADSLSLTRPGYECTGWSYDLSIFKPGDAVIGDMIVHANWQKLSAPQTNIQWDIGNKPAGIGFEINGQNAFTQNASNGTVLTITGGAGWVYNEQAETYSFTDDSITYYVRIDSTSVYTVTNNGFRPTITFGQPDENSALPYWVDITFYQQLPYLAQYDPRVNDVFVYAYEDDTQVTYTVTDFNENRITYSSSWGGNNMVTYGNRFPHPATALLPVNGTEGYLWDTDVIEFNGNEVQVYVVKLVQYKQWYESNLNKGMATYVAEEYWIGVEDGLFYRAVERYYNYTQERIDILNEYTLVSAPQNLHTIMRYSTTMNYTGGAYNHESSWQQELTGPSPEIIPQKDGMVFVGWALTSDGNVRFAYADGAFTPRYFERGDANQGAVSLYAVWEDAPVQQYTISYLLGNNSIQGSEQTFTLEDGTVTLKTVQQLGIESKIYIMYYYMGGMQTWYWPGASVSASELIQHADEHYEINIQAWYANNITIRINGDFEDSGYLSWVKPNGSSFVLPSKDDVEGEFSERAERYDAVRLNTEPGGTGRQLSFGAPLSIDDMQSIYDGSSYNLYVEWEALPLAQLIVHANNGTEEINDETVIPTNQPYHLPSYEELEWYWEYDGYVLIGFSLSADGSNRYGFGEWIDAEDLADSVQNGSVDLYLVWSDSAVRGYIYGNYDGAEPEYISEIILDGDPMILPDDKVLKDIWNCNGTPLGYAIEQDGDVAYGLGDEITYDEVIAVEGHCLYVVWEPAPEQYTVQYWLVTAIDEEPYFIYDYNYRSDTFMSDDDTYTIISAPQGCEDYVVGTVNDVADFTFGDEVDTAVLIDLADDHTVTLVLSDPSLLQ